MKPELKIEIGRSGVLRIRGLYRGISQKRELLAMTGKILPTLAAIDSAMQKT